MTRRQAEGAIRAVLRRIRRRAEQTSVAEIRRYELAVRALAQQVPTGRAGPMTPAAARELSRRLNALLNDVEAVLERAAAGSIRTITTEIRDDFKAVHAQLYRAAELPSGAIVQKFDALPQRTLRRMARASGRGRTLARIVGRNVDAARESVERYIRSATGKQPTDVAVRSVIRLLDGKAPIHLGELELEPTDVSGAKGILPRGRRIIATESFHAMREGTAEASERSPLILVGHWALSDRHAGLPSSPDECDDIANGGRTIDGQPGWYEPQDWPAAPHPHCGCFQDDVRTIDPADWPTR
jgi:hypothetical protein